MTISDTERILRQKATLSALASVKLTGLQPSQRLESLLESWTEGDASLDDILTALLAKVDTSND
jgi:hypothetical protein